MGSCGQQGSWLGLSCFPSWQHNHGHWHLPPSNLVIAINNITLLSTTKYQTFVILPLHCLYQLLYNYSWWLIHSSYVLNSTPYLVYFDLGLDYSVSFNYLRSGPISYHQQLSSCRSLKAALYYEERKLFLAWRETDKVKLFCSLYSPATVVCVRADSFRSGRRSWSCSMYWWYLCWWCWWLLVWLVWVCLMSVLGEIE